MPTRRGPRRSTTTPTSAPGVPSVAAECNVSLEHAVAAANPAGRPLFASNAALELPQDPVMRLWQLATTLREHRGDGHVCVLAVGSMVHPALAAALRVSAIDR